VDSDIPEKFAASITRVVESDDVSRMSLWTSASICQTTQHHSKNIMCVYIMLQKIFSDKRVIPRVFIN
jgi:hypothetical protein